LIMKKLIAISVVFALVAGVAFADTANGISVNAWGRGFFAPIQNVGDPKAYGEAVKDDAGDTVKGEAYGGSGVTWGGTAPRVDFRVNGDAEFVGFSAQILAESKPNNGPLDPTDNVYIWAKPFSSDIVKLTVGVFTDDTLRGKANWDTGFENFVLQDKSEDEIFSRLGTGKRGDNQSNLQDNSGFLLSSVPVDNLFIGLLLNGSLYHDWGGPGSGTKAADMYRYMQFALGYNIEGIGHARLQYVGGWTSVDPESDDYKKAGSKPSVTIDEDTGDVSFDLKEARIEFAFAITAVENLLVDLGFKFGLPVAFKDTFTVSPGLQIALGANYRMDAFSLGAFIQANMMGGATGKALGDKKAEDGLGLFFGLTPAYDIDSTTIGLDIGFKMQGESKFDGEGGKDDSSQLGFGVFVKQGLGSGSVKAGVAYKMAPTENNGDKKGANGSDVLSIPIILEYAFF